MLLYLMRQIVVIPGGQLIGCLAVCAFAFVFSFGNILKVTIGIRFQKKTTQVWMFRNMASPHTVNLQFRLQQLAFRYYH